MLVVVLNCWVIDDERHAMAVEKLDQLGKVRERPRQSVDLVNDDDVDLAGLYVGDEVLHGRPLHVATREAAIVIRRRQNRPAGR
jgi:hypothetical protein